MHFLLALLCSLSLFVATRPVPASAENCPPSLLPVDLFLPTDAEMETLGFKRAAAYDRLRTDELSSFAQRVYARPGVQLRASAVVLTTPELATRAYDGIADGDLPPEHWLFSPIQRRDAGPDEAFMSGFRREADPATGMAYAERIGKIVIIAELTSGTPGQFGVIVSQAIGSPEERARAHPDGT